MPPSTQCIYCRCETTKAEAVAHVLPEAVVENDLVLPRGTICTRCNQYLGHELDATLVQYPAVAVFIQFAALPGKSGSPRRQLGGISLKKHANGKSDLRMATSDYEMQLDDAGRHIVRWVVSPTRAFDMLRFRRALHHIALNAVALRNGGIYALRPEFDLIRQYVRRPRPREAWTFAEATVNTGAPPKIGVEWPYDDDRTFAAIYLGLTRFVVGFDPQHDFHALATHAGVQIIDPSVRKPLPAGLTYVELGPPRPAG